MAVVYIDPDVEGIDVEGGPADNTAPLQAAMNGIWGTGNTVGLDDEWQIRCDLKLQIISGIFAPNGGPPADPFLFTPLPGFGAPFLTDRGSTYPVAPQRLLSGMSVSGTALTGPGGFSAADVGARVAHLMMVYGGTVRIPPGLKIASVTDSTHAVLSGPVPAPASSLQVIVTRTGTRGCEIFTEYYASGETSILNPAKIEAYHSAPYDAARDGFHQFQIRGRNGWTIEGVTLTGPNAAVLFKLVTSQQKNVELDHCEDGAFVNCTFRYPCGDCRRWGDVGGISRNLRSTHCTSYGSGQQLLTPAAVDGYIDEDSRFERSAHSCWDLERFGGSDAMDNITFRRGLIRGPIHGNVLSGTTDRCVNLDIDDVLQDGHALDIHFEKKGANVDRGPIRVNAMVSNTMSKSSREMLQFDNCHDVEVTNNVGQVQASRHQVGALLTNNRGAYCVHDNDFPGATAQVAVTSGLNPGNCVGSPPPVQSTKPLVLAPIFAGDTSATVTTSEPDGSTIQMYRDGVADGAPHVSVSGRWAFTGLAAYVAGQAVTATVQAEGESVSAASDPVSVVTRPVTNRPVVTSPILSGSTTVSGTSSEPDGTTVQVLDNGAAVGLPVAVLGHAWSRGSLSPLVAGHSITAKATASGKSQSAASDPVVVTSPPPPTESDPPVVVGPIYAGDTTVSGTSTEAAGTPIQVKVGGVASGAPATVQPDHSWSKTLGAALTAGQAVTATATASGEVESDPSNTVTVATRPQSSRPTVSAPMFAGSVAVYGYVNEPDGTTIRVYDGATLLATGIASSGRWSVWVPPLVFGHGITATAQADGESVSASSDAVTVTTRPAIGGGTLGHVGAV